MLIYNVNFQFPKSPIIKVSNIIWLDPVKRVHKGVAFKIIWTFANNRVAGNWWRIYPYSA